MSEIKKNLFLKLVTKRWIAIAVLAVAGSLATILSNNPANARESSISSYKAPRLIEAAATQTRTNVNSFYQFTIEIPSGAIEPIEAIKIAQKPNLEDIDFNIEKTSAYFGKALKTGEAIGISRVDREENGIIVVFDRPIQPGNEITVSLGAKNPKFDGSYLFGVTAFGETIPALYLGSVRLDFDNIGF